MQSWGIYFSSTSLQARQTSGRVSSSDPKYLLFIKFIYSRLALLLLALLENAFDSDIRICSLHNSAVSDITVSKVSFHSLIRNYLSWRNWQQMLTSAKSTDVSSRPFSPFSFTNLRLILSLVSCFPLVFCFLSSLCTLTMQLTLALPKYFAPIIPMF